MTQVTIILTVLNGERYLARSIESCLQQTHKDFELLVVDGGSQDRTLDIVAQYQQHDTRVRLIHQPENAGKLPGAINLGMAHAKGEFITWTQDDSWYSSNAIEKMLVYLQRRPSTMLVYTDFWIVDESGKPIEYKLAETSTYEHMLEGDVVGQCFLFRRAIYTEIGPQKTEYFPVHEIPWRVRVSERFRIDPLHEPLMFYTFHGGSLTAQIGGWNLLRMMTIVLYREGYLDEEVLKKRLAEIDVDQGYEDYILKGDYISFWRHVISGIRRDAGHLRNRGLLKMMVKSCLPDREQYRAHLLAHWHKLREAEQKEFLNSFKIKGLRG